MPALFQRLELIRLSSASRALPIEQCSEAHRFGEKFASVVMNGVIVATVNSLLEDDPPEHQGGKSPHNHAYS